MALSLQRQESENVSNEIFVHNIDKRLGGIWI